jgi:nuclear pore complex protein Nup93
MQPTGSGLLGGSLGMGNRGGLLGGSIAGNSLSGGSLNFPKPEAQPVPQPTPNQSAYFDQLLERGKKRTNVENTGFGNLPSLQLGLSDIARKARNLGNGGPSAGDAKGDTKGGDTRAYYLLAASGVSTAGTLRDLNNFTAQAGAASGHVAGLADTDLDNYMTTIKTQSTLEMIQEGLQQSKRDFETFLEENVQMNWDEQRKKIYSHFGLGSAVENLQGSPMAASQSRRGAFGKPLGRSKSSMAFGASGMQKSVLGTSSQRGAFGNSLSTNTPEKLAGKSQRPIEDRANRDIQERYASEVTELNEARAQNLVYPILHRFAAVEDDDTVTDSLWISNSYKALIRISEESPSAMPRLNKAVKTWERKFVTDHLDENPNSARSVELRKRILRGSRGCLENMFWQKLEGVIARDPKVAQLGGIPQKINKVRAYIRVQSQHRALFKVTKEDSADYDKCMTKLTQIKTSAGDDFCWVLIFYLLRCGLVEEVYNYVVENQKAIRDIDRNFGKYMEAYHHSPDQRLPQDLRNEISTNYLSLTKIAADSQVDPYKVACYKVIGRCELSKKLLESVIPVEQEDLIWLQFSMAREFNRAEEAAGEAFGLDQLQDTIKGVEQRYFGAGEDTARGPSKGLLFFMQILAGLYENAVALLYSFNHTAAVHFAIALSYYGLLRVANLSTGAELRKYCLFIFNTS